MSHQIGAFAFADAQVASVRDDPASRLALMARLFRGPTGRAPRHVPFRLAALSFMRWQAERGVLNPLDASPAGSVWWRAMNERLLRDGCEAVGLLGGWAGEPSSQAVRLLWKQDPELYTRYKAYGQGKLKLLKLNYAEAVESRGFLESNEQTLDRLEAVVNEEIMEDFQPIFLSTNFADRPIRKMAEDVGLKELYDLTYSPLSGESHGDWGSLISHDLRRCANPLHRYHRIARFRPREQGLRLEHLRHAYNLMAETVEAIFQHYGLSVDDALERCANAFARAVGAEPSDE